MKLDDHNLICAFVAFLLAGFAGFALSGGLEEYSCQERTVQAPAQG